MCLVKYDPDTLHMKVAEEDIPVVKMLHVNYKGEIMTPYMYTPVKFKDGVAELVADGVTSHYSATLDSGEAVSRTESFGFDIIYRNGKISYYGIKRNSKFVYYGSSSVFEDVDEVLTDERLKYSAVYFNKGIHSFSDLESFDYYSPTPLDEYKERPFRYFIAHIPKGSYYFVGDNNEIVSDKLVIEPKEVAVILKRRVI